MNYSNADWLDFSDIPTPRREPFRELNTGERATATPRAPFPANGFKPRRYTPFADGQHLAVCYRAEWLTGPSGRQYLFIVWRDPMNKRGASVADSLFLNAGSPRGQELARQRLEQIADAAGVSVSAIAADPAALVGAFVTVEIVTKKSWREGVGMEPQVERYKQSPTS